jgi:hypothetical protein
MTPPTGRPRRPFLLPAMALVLALSSCETAGDLIYEPAADDPLDGYRGSLAQAGINTEMDWGPKQATLLSEFKTLNEAKVSLEKQLAKEIAENQNLKARLGDEGKSLEKERALRAQAEAEAEMLRQRRRDLEARILSLSIEKAKIEQSQLLGRIEALRQSMQESEPAIMEAATPPRQR